MSKPAASPPTRISYRAIIPKPEHCTNLLVPVCLSSSHIAYGSIRMEPVFMILGQSAATAALLALDGHASVHVNYPQLYLTNCSKTAAVLAWTPPRPRPDPPNEMMPPHEFGKYDGSMRGPTAHRCTSTRCVHGTGGLGSGAHGAPRQVGNRCQGQFLPGVERHPGSIHLARWRKRGRPWRF